MTKAFDWASLVGRSAEQAQFGDAALLRGYAFRLQGDVSPSVQVFFQPVTNTHIAPIVFLGIYVEAFEREWLERLRRTVSPSDETDGDPPFCRLATNIGVLSPRPWAPPESPSSEDVAAMQDWFGKVFAHAKRLPRSLGGLITAINANDVDGAEVWRYLAHPVKVRGFAQWLRRTCSVDVAEHLLPHLEDRTEPYDVNVMLDDPTS